MPWHKKHWIRHTALVPKGFLRYQVLELLGEKPMSGSEMINDIAERTDGGWKPSPGSIYPLLAWLQDNGHIIEHPADEVGMKRYALTEKGVKLLEEQRGIKRNLRKEARFFEPPFLGALWFRIPKDESAKFRDSMKRLVEAFFELGASMEERFSKEALGETVEVLDQTAERLEAIDKKLRRKNNA